MIDRMPSEFENVQDAVLTDDACYLAMQTHDARFDGSFFTAVTSTGIYCRPVCRVKTPMRENCRFFRHAAQAEHAGFRPCLRCRPELAPHVINWSTEDASRMLALQAARLIDAPDAWQSNAVNDVDGDEDADADGPGVAQIAERLGVSDRHLRRIFEAQLGVSPMQYLQTRRLLTAKQLIADTALSMTQVAHASGFASIRRFNAAFVAHYGLNPSEMRRAEKDTSTKDQRHDGAISVRLGYRPPYDTVGMQAFMARHALKGAETGDGDWFASTLRVNAYTGWIKWHFDTESSQLRLSVSESLATVLPIVIGRVRALLDLDAEPMAINALLHDVFPTSDGSRVPGTLDGFELAVRAVLGQQITVAAARTIGGRLVEAFGEQIETPVAGLDRLFPTPDAIAAASSDALGKIGIVRQRQGAMHALANEVRAGRLALHPGADVPSTLKALQALPGIGDWTAQYIAMRALRWPDAFPAGDVALQKAMGVATARAAAEASLVWRPWRSYAVLRAWYTPPVSAQAPARKTDDKDTP